MLSLVVLLFSLVCVVSQCIIKHDKYGNKKAICQNQGLTSVPKNLPSDIKTLDLDKNDITTIKGFDFVKYRKLEQLYINENKLEILDVKGFNGLSFLRQLSLSGNNLNVSTSYPRGIFVQLSNLTVLDVSRNSNSINVSQGLNYYNLPLDELTSLRELSIDLIYEPIFSQDFRNLKNLKKLVFDFCVVKILRNETFANLPKTITSFHLTTCRDFVTVEANVLSFFPQLSILNLTGSNFNLIQVLTKFLYPLQNKTLDMLLLREVTFPAKHPSKIPKKYDYDIILTAEMMKYISTICLKTLDLSDNLIVKIQQRTFEQFQYPQCFENFLMSGNRFGIDNFVEEFFGFLGNMTNLKILDYSYIPIAFRNPLYIDVINGNMTYVASNNAARRTTSVSQLRFPSHIEFVRLSHIMATLGIQKIEFVNSSLNWLEIKYFDTNNFPTFQFEGYNNLEHLDLSGIRSTLTITYPPKFPTLVNLKTLIMKHTEFYKLVLRNWTIFSGWVPNLQNLDISGNSLLFLRHNSFGNLPSLARLNLSHNLFDTVPDVLTTLENIVALDLSINHLSSLPKNVREWIDRQQTKFGTFKLYLRDNPFMCSCDTRDFIVWLFKTKAVLDRDGNYSCATNIGWKYNFTRTVYDDFHRFFVECEAKIWLKIGISLLVLTTIVISVITVLYIFRLQIIFFFYRQFRSFAEKQLEINFTYDIYLSYSDDHCNIVRRITHRLENDWGLRICCKDRDFCAGEACADEIARSIHSSRHIIFLVTPWVVQNEWCNYEIEKTKYEKCAKHLEKIIVIIRDVNVEQIPTKFATIWKDIQVIEWPSDDDNDSVAMALQRLHICLFGLRIS